MGAVEKQWRPSRPSSSTAAFAVWRATPCGSGPPYANAGHCAASGQRPAWRVAPAWIASSRAAGELSSTIRNAVLDDLATGTDCQAAFADSHEDDRAEYYAAPRAGDAPSTSPTPEDELHYDGSSVRRTAFDAYTAAVEWTDYWLEEVTIKPGCDGLSAEEPGRSQPTKFPNDRRPALGVHPSATHRLS